MATHHHAVGARINTYAMNASRSSSSSHHAVCMHSSIPFEFSFTLHPSSSPVASLALTRVNARSHVDARLDSIHAQNTNDPCVRAPISTARARASNAPSAARDSTPPRRRVATGRESTPISNAATDDFSCAFFGTFSARARAPSRRASPIAGTISRASSRRFVSSSGRSEPPSTSSDTSLARARRNSRRRAGSRR